ncbi:hypothetical protein [Streptomyces sp. NBC_01794]|uniref:hypothetical protein n=1 Tax=Streptomyces sp. NBC_01794 TaxID=2975942 RepID=UPI003092C654|nr:hypothetical protein OIE54_39220 [Streptomyces sp. NBC_01794]
MTGPERQAPPSGTVASFEPLLDIQLQLLIRLLEAERARSVRQLGGRGAQLLAEFPETVDRSLDEVIGEEAPEHLPRWIHLRDATPAGAEGPFTVPAWRGRLADVSGWSLTRPK